MSSSSSNAPCAACTFLRRQCTQECVFAPHFSEENLQIFIDLHRDYRIETILQQVNPSLRKDAIDSLCFEAMQRLQNPAYGCMGLPMDLHRRLSVIERDLDDALRAPFSDIESSLHMGLLMGLHRRLSVIQRDLDDALKAPFSVMESSLHRRVREIKRDLDDAMREMSTLLGPYATL